MKKFLALLLSALLVLSSVAIAEAPALIDGTYTAEKANDFGSIALEIEVVDGKIVGCGIEPAGDQNFLTEDKAMEWAVAILEAQTADCDTITGASLAFSVATIQEAFADVYAQATGAVVEANDAPLAFTAGAYEATSNGYNGPVTLKVTFTDAAVESIEVVASAETEHVGTVAIDTMIPDIVNYNTTGVDAVAGATFTGLAIRNAVLDAAQQAGCTNVDAFKAPAAYNTEAAAIEETYDVIVVGGGGAGMAAAAQAVQEGNTVVIVEKNAEVGGNTLVSGGQYQSVMPYLVWDAADPDATTGVYAFTGDTYDKVKSVQGCIDELKMILNWSEEAFDEEYYKNNEFVAGDAKELSKHGVHAEYLPVLQALKAEIQAYLDWAQPQLDAGVSENQLTLFSTLNLHIFQTYYGGLRQSADKTEWIYGDVDLVSQFINDGQGLKEWLEEQGATFKEEAQSTLIGALWYRENEFIGSTIDLDGDGENEMGRWGSYFAAPLSTVNGTEGNAVMTSTAAKELIVEDGRVTGVKAVKHADGVDSDVTLHANKGVILCTGGYAANIDMVLADNVYWSSEYLTTSTKTTNRSSQIGDGINMAVAAGAATTGMGFTQLMPISWVDNGNLAFGGGNYACWINPTTGKRFVDEGSERDVLSLAEFKNGMEVNGTQGVFLEFYNKEQLMPAPMQLAEGDYAGRFYRRTIADLPALFEELGVTADPATVIETIRAYDMAVMGQGEYPDCDKAIASRTIGNVELNEDGSYNVETYDLDNALLTIRLMAPSTHHTMGGLVVDTERHVLDAEGNAIAGLYAAGEVTGGIHGGNRLGGNAIVEIFVSGRTAAKAVTADNQ